MRLAAACRAGQRSAAAAPVHAVAGAGRGAVGPAILPDLSQFTAQLLSRHRPVVFDVVAQFHHMPLNLELVLLQPRHVQFLARRSTLELSGDVLVVVANNPVERK